MHALLKPTNPSGRVLRRLSPKLMKITWLRGCFNSLSHHNLVHKPVSILHAMKILDGNAAVDKEWEKLKDLPAWRVTKVKSKKEVIEQAQKEGRTVRFATLMDLCHLTRNWNRSSRKYNGRVVQGEDGVKDDSGSDAVFTEQGSSASQMTAAKVLDFAGQASDAVSAYAQVKVEDAPKLVKLPESECPAIWIRSPRHQCPKSWQKIEEPDVLLKRNSYGHP